jgi:hypothetical protein
VAKIVVPTPNTTITSAWGKSVADAINGSAELAYTQITANVTVTAAETPVVAAPAVVFDGTPVLVEFYASAVVPAEIARATVELWLFQDGGSLGRMAVVSNPAASGLYMPVFAVRRLTPTAGSHTFAVRATRGGGDGAIAAGTGGAGTYAPAYIRVVGAT